MNRFFLILSVLVVLTSSCVKFPEEVHEEVLLSYKNGNCEEETSCGLFGGCSTYEKCEVIFIISDASEWYSKYEDKEVSIDGEMAKKLVELDPRYGDKFTAVVVWEVYKNNEDTPLRHPEILDVIPRDDQ